MKIYINNFNVQILDKIVKKLNEQYVSSETYIKIYSIDGIYQINEKNTNKQIVHDTNVKIYENFYEDFTLIVDNSYCELESVNQIHPDNISTCIKRNFFKIDSNYNLQLVIEGIFLDDMISPINSKNNNIKHNDIYFELPNNTDINDALVKKEIIVFLSLLNNIVI
jgi:hypothetical protein